MPSSGVPHGHAVLQGTPLGTVYLRQQIASGSTCTVFRALHPGPPAKFVAVKYITLPPASAPEDGNFKKLMREVKIHETLRHRNVLEMLGGEVREKEEGWPRGLFIVMKLASGGDLFDKIRMWFPSICCLVACWWRPTIIGDKQLQIVACLRNLLISTSVSC